MITQKWLKDKYNYDKETGVFINRKSKKLLGGIDKYGYLRTHLKGKGYRLHRLAWLYFYGELPSKNIDHINGNASDNRIDNLREAEQTLNLKNMRKRSDNKSGATGIWWDKCRNNWQVYINLKGKIFKHLGRFNNKFDALAARKSAEIKNNYHKNHGRC